MYHDCCPLPKYGIVQKIIIHYLKINCVNPTMSYVIVRLNFYSRGQKLAEFGGCPIIYFLVLKSEYKRAALAFRDGLILVTPFWILGLVSP